MCKMLGVIFTIWLNLFSILRGLLGNDTLIIVIFVIFTFSHTESSNYRHQVLRFYFMTPSQIGLGTRCILGENTVICTQLLE